MSTWSCAVCVTIFSNGSIIPPGFKFTELHALTLADCSYALLVLGLHVGVANAGVRRFGYEASQRVSHLQCDLAGDQLAPRAHEARRNEINT